MEKYSFKIITLGNFSVGKTSLIIRASKPELQFSQISRCSLGIDIQVLTIQHQGFQYQLKLWDTAGQQRYFPISQHYYKDCDGALLIFDLNCEYSFWSIPKFLQKLNENALNTPKIILVGNKNDQPRKVVKEKVDQFARKYNLTYIQTSVLTGQNVQKVFRLMIKKLLEYQRPTKKVNSFLVSKEKSILGNSIKRKRCCN